MSNGLFVPTIPSLSQPREPQCADQRTGLSDRIGSPSVSELAPVISPRLHRPILL